MFKGNNLGHGLVVFCPFNHFNGDVLFAVAVEHSHCLRLVTHVGDDFMGEFAINNHIKVVAVGDEIHREFRAIKRVLMVVPGQL